MIITASATKWPSKSSFSLFCTLQMTCRFTDGWCPPNTTVLQKQFLWQSRRLANTVALQTKLYYIRNDDLSIKGIIHKKHGIRTKCTFRLGCSQFILNWSASFQYFKLEALFMNFLDYVTSRSSKSGSAQTFPAG